MTASSESRTPCAYSGKFWERKVELPIFAGDIIHSENCYTFEGLGIPIKLVCGNNDGDRAGLARESSHRSSERPDDFWQIRAAGSDCPVAWRASSFKAPPSCFCISQQA